MIASRPSSALPTAPSTGEKWLPWILAAISTAAAFASHALFGAPGDHPLPLLGFGCLVAFVGGSARRTGPVLVGLAALAGFPVEALVDLLLRGGHSLLPFEFIFYALYGGAGVVAAFVGRAVGAALTGQTNAAP
jgi:peptidoglycan/LPS O-acetylase OafA/YrhL